MKKGHLREKLPDPKKRAVSLKQLFRENKALFITYFLLRFFVILLLIASILERNFENVFTCVGTLFLFLIPSIAERRLKIEFPSAFQILILLFIFASLIMGEVESFYVKVPYWDDLVHTVSGFMFAALGFALVDVLNTSRSIRFHLSPFYLAFFAFCFAMTVAVMWEIFEFSADMLLGKDMQKDTVIQSFNSCLLNPDGKNVPVFIGGITDTAVNGQSLGVNGYLDIGLIDTMTDCIVCFIGAMVFSVIGYFYEKGKVRSARYIIPVSVKTKEMIADVMADIENEDGAEDTPPDETQE